MATRSITTGNWQIDILDDGKVEVTQDGFLVRNVKEALREISGEVGFDYETGWTTRQFGKKLMAFLQSGDDDSLETYSRDDDRDSLDVIYDKYIATIEKYKDVCQTDILRITQLLNNGDWAEGYPISITEYDDDRESEHEVTEIRFKDNGVEILEQWLNEEIVTTDQDRPLFIGIGHYNEYLQTMYELTSVMEDKIELFQDNAPVIESLKPDYQELIEQFHQKTDDDYDFDFGESGTVKVFTHNGKYVHAKNLGLCPLKSLDGPAAFYINEAVDDDDNPIEYDDWSEAEGNLFSVENLEALEEIMAKIRVFLSE